MRYTSSLVLGFLFGMGAAASSFAQPAATPKSARKQAESPLEARREPEVPHDREGRGPGPGGRGGFGGPGGPGGFMGQERAIVKQFDKDNNGRLDQAEPAAPAEGRRRSSLRSFVEQRRAYLLKATQPSEAR